MRRYFHRPRHPYTRALIAVRPRLDLVQQTENWLPFRGAPPDLLNPPVDVRSAPAAATRMPICTEQMPEQTDARRRDTRQPAGCIIPWLRRLRMPNLEGVTGVTEKEVLLSVTASEKVFSMWENAMRVDDVSFDIYKGETLGSGGRVRLRKTTCGRTVSVCIPRRTERFCIKGKMSTR
ncbi:MAG: hypothetical protein ACLRPV_04420 [Lacrimispora saccharolytica]